MKDARSIAHDELVAGTDLARIHRFSLLIAIAWGGFTINNAVTGRYVLASINAIAFVVVSTGAALAFSKISWRDRVSLPLVVGGSFIALMAIALISGGADAPAMGFLSLIPLVSGLFRQRAQRLGWLLVSLAGIALVPVLHERVTLGLSLEVTVAQRAVAAVGLAVLLYGFGSEWRASSDAQAALLEARARTIEAQAEQIRLARDEALRASEQKSRFVAMTSHELRGPLNGILGMSHALEGTRLGDAQRELVRALSTSAESLSGLLANLLDIARIEAGRLDVVLAPTEMREVLADVVDAFALDAARKNLDIAALSDASVPHVVQADAGRLAQVLRNLVSNAVKFTEVGSVVVEAHGVRGMLEISVTDTGEGMRPEDIGRIFAPFEQVSAELIDRRAGTGLGLWISRNLVERWGGTIEVTSELGRGTTFRVTVPTTDDALDAPRTSVPTASPVLALTRRPLTARAFESVARELALAIDVHESLSAAGTAWQSAHAIVADVESLAEAEIEALARLGLGPRLVLASRAARIPECERIAERSLARVLLLPVRARRLASALDRGEAVTESMRDEARRQLKGTLLVVDDDVINRKVARHAAEQLGLDVLDVASGEEALRVVQESRVDVVLLDLHLEGLAGDVIADRLRRALGTETPAIIAYTGTVKESDRRRLKEAGMEDILAKPLDRSAFSAVVSRALHARRRRTRPSMVPPAPSAFEPGALGELALIMGDRALALEMLTEVIPQLTARVEAIRSAIAAPDLAQIGAESHKLASSAATFGAYKLASTARSLELAARDQKLDQLAALGVELAEAHTEVLPLLRAQLPRS